MVCYYAVNTNRTGKHPEITVIGRCLQVLFLSADGEIQMNERMLNKGDSIQVHFNQNSIDWGVFHEYLFFGEDDGIEEFLIYEIPAEQVGDKVREVIKFIPINSIMEVRGMTRCDQC